MPRLLSYMLLGTIVFGTVVLWPIELGRADEITKKFSPIPIVQQEVRPVASVVNTVPALENPKIAKFITKGEAAERIVSNLGLNLDGYRFFKAPEITDFFNDVNQDASYAKALIILGYNGILDTSERIFSPSQVISREEVAQLVFRLLNKRAGDIIFHGPKAEIKDAINVSNNALNDVLVVVGLGLMSTNSEGKFQPEQGITLKELELIIQKTAKIINTQDSGVTAKIIINKDGAREVELSWGEKPSSGYEIIIEKMIISGNTLHVYYSTLEPTPDSYNSTVITEPKDTEQIPFNYPTNLQIELHRL